MKMLARNTQLNTPDSYATIPEVFRNYVSWLDAGEGIPKSITKPKSIHHFFGRITSKEVLSDLDEVLFYLNYVYAGKRYFEKQGYDLYKAYLRLKEKIAGYKWMEATEFADILNEELRQGFFDHNFKISHPLGNQYTLGRTKHAYFADILVEKVDGHYFVVGSKVPMIYNGDEVTTEETNYFATLSPTGRQFYLIGVWGFEAVKRLTIKINGALRKVKLHKCLAGEDETVGDACFSKATKNGMTIIHSNTFETEHKAEFLLDKKSLQEMRNCAYVIWNIVNNEGGRKDLPLQFMKEFNDYAAIMQQEAWLKTPYSTMEPTKEWYREWKFVMQEPFNYENAKYSGKMVTIMNTKTRGAAEDAVGLTKSVKNHAIVGENTCGENIFEDVRTVTLTHTRVELSFGCKILLGECKEGQGYEPDYWIDSKELENEVVMWLRDGESYFPSWMK